MIRNIRVQVKTEPDPDRTFPDLGHWFYRYTVTITNEGGETAQFHLAQPELIN